MEFFKRSIGLLIICFSSLNLCHASNTGQQPTQEEILQKAQIYPQRVDFLRGVKPRATGLNRQDCRFEWRALCASPKGECTGSTRVMYTRYMRTANGDDNKVENSIAKGIDIAGNIAYQKEAFEKLYNYTLKLKTCSVGIYEIPNPASSTIPPATYHIKGWEDNKCVVEMTQKAPDLGDPSRSKPASVTIICKYSQKTLESMGSTEELEKIRKGELDLSGRSPAMGAAMTECTVKINHSEN